MDEKLNKIIAGKEEGLKVFEDDKVVAVLNESPAAQGHIVIFPKEHYPIVETVPDNIVGHMFNIANKLSSIVFEKLNAHGTNIIINNGLSAGQDVNQFSMNIVPRWQNDGLNFEWTPKKLSEDEMSTISLMISEETKNVGVEKIKEKEVIEKDSEATETISDDGENGVENYMIKQLNRLP